MENNRDINNIRPLLQRFYEGETSREEEQILEAFFSDTSADDMPDDMVADMKMFSAMKALRPTAEESELPSDLLSKLDEIVASPAHPKKRRLPLILRYSSIAAAAALLWAIVSLMPRFFDSNIDMPAAHTAEVVRENDTLSIAGTADLPAEVEADDDFIEITDPEEARTIALEIGRLLAQNADQSNEAISQLGTAINNYKEITKSVLQ